MRFFRSFFLFAKKNKQKKLKIEKGISPQAAAATSALAVVVNSSSATLQWGLLGYIEYTYLAFFMSISIVGTFFGQTVVDYCVKHYGRQSVVVFAVGIVIGAAVILMGVEGVIEVVGSNVSLSFSDFC